MSCHENEVLAEKLMEYYLDLGYSDEEAESLTVRYMDFADRPTVDENGRPAATPRQRSTYKRQV